MTEEPRLSYEDVAALLDEKVRNSEIRIELCGHLEHQPGLGGFTLDKTRYRLRFEDETDESVKVVIERKTMSLGPTEIEEYAANAYKLFAEQTNTAASWESVPNKHVWRDCVTTWERHPRAIPSGAMEECVALVFQIAADVEKAKTATVEAPPEVAPVEEPPASPVEEPTKKGSKK